MPRTPEIIYGTDDTPPQIHNEDLMPDADEHGTSPSARAIVDAWYAAHPEQLNEK